jgi:hypothetical protein
MSAEFEKYKALKIKQLTNIYNINVNNLNIYYNNALNNIKRSKNTNANKNKLIQNLNNEITLKFQMLKKQYDNDILKINNLAMPEIKNIKNNSALLIGINYFKTNYELFGCINDANAICSLISDYNFNKINILTDNVKILEKIPNRNNIIREFKNLLIDSQAGDVLLLFYSGHGSYILDKNNNEKTGKDQMIIPCDFNSIVDDEFKSIIQTNLKKDVTLIALFDCCHSGTVLDLKYQYMDSLEKNNYTENANETETIGNVIMISGCNDIQTSSDSFFNNKNQGAMTWAFLQAFKSEKDITWRKLLIKMRDLLQKSNFSQIPQLSSGSFLNIDSPVFI